MAIARTRLWSGNIPICRRSPPLQAIRLESCIWLLPQTDKPLSRVQVGITKLSNHTQMIEECWLCIWDFTATKPELHPLCRTPAKHRCSTGQNNPHRWYACTLGCYVLFSGILKCFKQVLQGQRREQTVMMTVSFYLIQATHCSDAAGDETLRFWNVFPGPRTATASQETTVGSMMRTQIR